MANMDVTSNLQHIRESIADSCQKVNRDSSEITLIAVTKYVTIERTEETINAGVSDLGENRQDGLLDKYEHIQDRAKWHFIGTLQTRKVREIIDKADVIHSLDRKSLAKEINKRTSRQMDCFVQVNVSGEDSKHGLSPENVIPFIKEMSAFDNIRVVGLMTMAPHIDDQQQIRSVFKKLADLRNAVMKEKFQHAPCEYLSMGMSNDYQIAIEEGATHIRIGSKLVGSEQ